MINDIIMKDFDAFSKDYFAYCTICEFKMPASMMFKKMVESYDSMMQNEDNTYMPVRLFVIMKYKVKFDISKYTDRVNYKYPFSYEYNGRETNKLLEVVKQEIEVK